MKQQRIGRRWLKMGGLVLVIGAGMVLVRALNIPWADLSPHQVRNYVVSFGWWAPAMYLAVFAQPIVPLPATVMLMASGLAFGAAGGLGVALAAALLRSWGQFTLARWLGRDAVTTLLKGRLVHWDARLGERAFQSVLLIRLIPNVPFDLQNYGLGLTRVPIGTFLLATAIGSFPSIGLWVYMGHTLTDLRQAWALMGALLAFVLLRYVIWKGRSRQPLEVSQVATDA